MDKIIVKQEKGITLIALIITIIVMLILVAVTITMAINGGLFGYAKNATRDTEVAKLDEQNLVNIESGLSTDDLIEKYTDTGGGTGKPAYSTTLLDENGVLTKNAIYTDSNTETVEIPKGFGVVEDFKIRNQGLVISDQFDSNGNSIGNEFVWIPVEDYTLTGNLDENGLDSGFLAYFKRSEWNNNARSTDLTTSTTYTENASNDPTGKYNKMMQSVQEHKGFYIGRYETGQKENGSIVIKRDKKPYTNIKWGDSMTEVGTTGAVYLSQNMYTGDSHNVTSTLCYGVQWDAMLDFIKDSNHNVNLSSDWGAYKDTNADIWRITRTTAQFYRYEQWHTITTELTKSASDGVKKLTTGANDNFQAKNIFDVAGNVYEWTMEARSSNLRLFRGGYCDGNGNNYPASIRNYGGNGATHSSNEVGFRVALYL